MQSHQLRKEFLNFFKKSGHAVIPSSPVVPHGDPTLLFINAGMNQFKDLFLGKEKRDFTKAATSQKCIRVGGKHNDLENVGHTARHLTFFEMLGNFSFGDYFKKEAIAFAWEATNSIFRYDPKKIHISVFREDDEAFELWKQFVPEERIVRMDEKDNFWAMGDTGPCGPCSELYYDRGEAFGKARNPKEDTEGTRFLEFWNLVFMQFNRLPSGEMQKLAAPSIDTGAGLERVLSLGMQVDSVFETDVLRSLIAEVETLSGKTYRKENQIEAAPFRVIADHLRALAFAIADGAQPSNIERGYVLRKVLRRAVRYGRQIGLHEPFLAKLLPKLTETMGADYPELKLSEMRTGEILMLEEESFQRTLKRGGSLLRDVIARSEKSRVISGDDAFTLKDTYGLPFDEIALLAKDAGLSVDEKRFEEQEKAAKERSKQAHKKTHQLAEESLFKEHLEKKGPTRFSGYHTTSGEAAITALLKEGAFVDSLTEGDEGIVILDETPFYAEMGGQVGDRGLLSQKNSSATVEDTKSPFKGVTAHFVTMTKGKLSLGDRVTAAVDEARRRKIAANHTATHLLHWALRKVLGEHVKQAGSVVDPERLRFDFSHHKALTKEEIREIEDLVTEEIRKNRPVASYEIAYEEASKRKDIIQFFGDKYGTTVRVIDIEPSKELCGGTHTERAGDIGSFRISSEKSIAQGVRRIEAVTGKDAERMQRESDDQLEKAGALLKATPEKFLERLEKLLEEKSALESTIRSLESKRRKELVDSLSASKVTLAKAPFIGAVVQIDPKELRLLADEIAEKCETGCIALATANSEKSHLLIRLSDDLVKKGLDAKALIEKAALLIGGAGGGKSNAAQAGGKPDANLTKAVEAIRDTLR